MQGVCTLPWTGRKPRRQAEKPFKQAPPTSHAYASGALPRVASMANRYSVEAATVPDLSQLMWCLRALGRSALLRNS